MSSSVEDPMHLMSDDITAQTKCDNLPIKSKDKYLNAYDNFIQWKTDKGIDFFTENVLIAYFYERSRHCKPSSLWSIYTMLKSTLLYKNGIDIKFYPDLIEFLKKQSEGYRPRITKSFTAADIESFLNRAPDEKYLATKVALIFGITGACRREDLANLTVHDVENHGETILVTIRTKTPRSFSVHGDFTNKVKKYQSIRSVKGNSNRFFQNYQNGRCTAQNIGVNKFGAMPKEIALYLKLPEPELYTGHSFRRTSAVLLPKQYPYQN